MPKLALALLALLGAGSSAAALDWALPGAAPGAPRVWDNTEPRTLPGSAEHFTEAQLRDRNHAVDWRPGEHPPLPASVASGSGGAAACGFCHLPDGLGRPENAALAGLPAD